MSLPRMPSSSLSAELKEVINQRNMLTTRTRMKVLSALDEIENYDVNEKRKNLRSQAIHEILTSEVTYLHHLEIIMEFFMRPVCEKKLLHYASYTTLFENIEILYNVNAELLKELKQNPDNIALAFHRLAPFFKLYSVYAYNYKRALLLLQEIQRNDPKTAQFINNQEKRPEVNNKLSALLITPIQRVPRYRLLLKEVLRHTLPKESDYEILQASLAQIEDVANHINSLVEEYENNQQLLELQKHIVNSVNLIKPGRKLIRQGPLMKVSKRGNSSLKRHFVLLSDTLLYCKGDPEHSLTICCLLPLNKCKIEPVLSNGLFRVVCIQENLLLYSENGDGEAWIKCLQDAIIKYIECRQTLKKDSSSRIPMRDMNLLSSDNILRRYRRKRSLDINKTILPSSKIIYINRDLESEVNSSHVIGSCLLSCKKLKASFPDDMPMNEKIQMWMNGLRNRQQLRLTAPSTNNNEEIKDLNENHQVILEKDLSTGYSNEGFSNCELDDDLMDFAQNLTNADFSEEFNESSFKRKFDIYFPSAPPAQRNRESIFFLRKINRFFSNVGNTLRNLINRF